MLQIFIWSSFQILIPENTNDSLHHLHWDFLSSWLWLENSDCLFRRLSQSTKRRSQFSSHSHESSTKKSQYKRTFRYRNNVNECGTLYFILLVKWSYFQCRLNKKMFFKVIMLFDTPQENKSNYVMMSDSCFYYLYISTSVFPLVHVTISINLSIYIEMRLKIILWTSSYRVFRHTFLRLVYLLKFIYLWKFIPTHLIFCNL